ncbi:MAG: glycoside hydrolase family 92 protein [Dysgonamonadaceae bacterium]|nr:glycoside hydrolase family 92 protein [Dysgonamonadaceae bacterium]
MLGAPQLPEVTIQISENKTFKVLAHHLSKENKYVKSVRLNGKEWKELFTLTSKLRTAAYWNLR